jgi:ribosomal protein L19
VREAANILNNQLRTTDEGWSFSIGDGREIETPHRKISTILLRNITHGLGLERIFGQTGEQTHNIKTNLGEREWKGVD